MNRREKDYFIQECRVAYSDVGEDAHLKPLAALNLCQDISSRHAFLLELSALHMEKFNKIWVVHSYHFDFYRFPEWDEAFSIKSWRTNSKKLYELRNCLFLDSNGKKLMESQAAWVLVDKESKRPVRLNSYLKEDLLKAEDSVSFENKKLPLPDKDIKQLYFKVLKDDMDYNRHANNTSYLKWGLETLKKEELFPCKIKEFDIRYHREARLDDTVRLESSKQVVDGEKTYTQALYRENGGELLASINISLL